MPPRGFDQGDLVMATLRYFRPRIVSEEGSCVWVLGLLGLPALPRGLLLGHTRLDALLRWIATWASPTPTHTHSIFCLQSLTSDATNAMLTFSRFVVSIRTRRHRPWSKPKPPKHTHPPRDVVHVEEERGQAVVVQRHADDRGVALGHSG